MCKKIKDTVLYVYKFKGQSKLLLSDISSGLRRTVVFDLLMKILLETSLSSLLLMLNHLTLAVQIHPFIVLISFVADSENLSWKYP